MTVSQYRESIGVFDVRITRKVDAIIITNDQPILKAEKQTCALPPNINIEKGASQGIGNAQTNTESTKKSVVVNKRGRTKVTNSEADPDHCNEPVRKLPNFGEVFDQARAKPENSGALFSKKGFRLKRKNEVHEKNRGGTLDSFMNITSKKHAK